MTRPISQTRMITQFSCLGDKCEDTCCKGWGMQLDDVTLSRYKASAPELLQAIDSGEAEHIMRRDPETDYCVKFDHGLCSIHRDYGTDFLGDACHFYPRVTRSLGDTVYMTALLSCPEVARLALFSEGQFALDASEIERLPQTLKSYLPAGLDERKAMDLHLLFLNALDANDAPERILSRLLTVARSLDSQAVTSWPDTAPFYLKKADSLLAAPEFAPADPFNLLHALSGLIASARKSQRPRLMETIADMERALHVTLDWKTVTIQTQPDSLSAYQRIEQLWRSQWAEWYAPLLRRYVQAQLSLAFFPFAGFGEKLRDRMTIIAVRFATVKLALMCACAMRGALPQADVVRVVQSVSRFMDHLADPTLSLAIYKETGWIREERMRALIGDF